MAEFSGRGEECTPFERALLELDVPVGAIAEGLEAWADLARQIGLPALLKVLDHLGGEKPHVPTRKHFFEGLWRHARDAEIRRQLAAGASPAEVAECYALSARMVRRIGRGADDRAAARVVKGRL